MIRRHALCLPLAAALAACATAEPAPTTAAAPAKKRAAPEPVAPLVIGSVRYEVVPWGRTRGMRQDGGVIRAVDAGSGRELWLLQVYTLQIDPRMETDKQEVFITTLSADPDGRGLFVDTERGARHRVDLSTRRVTDVR